jgi:monofunctional biosynthetic peptidoglycan transglycosylase
MANGFDENKAMKKKPFLSRVWKWAKRIFITLFILQLLYIILLRWVDPPITITQFSSWLKGYGLQRDYIRLGQISPDAKLAFIAAEDQLFPDHNGFDWKGIKKAMEYNKRKPGRIRGASTISQQVAKNVFLWQGRSWFRKALEAYFTFMIELLWGKKRILEVYMNVIETGKGVFGIEAAAKKYFNKPANKLTRREAAMIAAILPNPKRYKVNQPTPYVSSRSLWVMQQMNNIGDDPELRKLLE